MESTDSLILHVYELEHKKVYNTITIKGLVKLYIVANGYINKIIIIASLINMILATINDAENHL